MLRLRGVVVYYRKKIHKEEGEMGEEGRSLGHKLNIIDGITDGIIPSVTPSVKYHVTI